MSDRHAAFAVLDTGERVRLTPWEDWHKAIATWTLLDDERVRLRQRADGWTNVAYFAVRAEDDAQWNTAPIGPEKILGGTGPGSRDERAVIRRVGESRGLYGRAGGWIYDELRNRAPYPRRIRQAGETCPVHDCHDPPRRLSDAPPA